MQKIKMSCRDALAIALAGVGYGFRIASMYRSENSLTETEAAIKDALQNGKWRVVSAKN